MRNQKYYRRNNRRLEAKLTFWEHLGVYLAVNALLFMISLCTSADYLWFKWPLFGWGIGVFFHGLAAFPFSSGKSGEAKEGMIQRDEKRRGSAWQIAITKERARA